MWMFGFYLADLFGKGRRCGIGGATKTLFEELCQIIRQTFVSWFSYLAKNTNYALGWFIFLQKDLKAADRDEKAWYGKVAK